MLANLGDSTYTADMKAHRSALAMVTILWQLPQVLLAIAVLAATRARRRQLYRGVAVFEAARPRGGVSFGPIILMNRSARSERLLRHEYGHSRQSVMLGPFYLIVVGLPSVTFAALTRAGLLDRQTYFTRFPENWADRLGGVQGSTSST